MYRCMYQATGRLVCPYVQEHFATALNQVPGSALDNNGYLYMYPGDVMKSPNGKFTMTFEQDGNLVIRRDDGMKIWHANVTTAYPLIAKLQEDGNFVLYKSTNAERSDWQWYWATNTNGRGPFSLQLHDTGRLILYDKNNTELWSNPVPEAAPQCKTTPLVAGGCVNACRNAFNVWANGDNKTNMGTPGMGGQCSCVTPPGCVLPPGFSQ